MEEQWPAAPPEPAAQQGLGAMPGAQAGLAEQALPTAQAAPSGQVPPGGQALPGTQAPDASGPGSQEQAGQPGYLEPGPRQLWPPGAWGTSGSWPGGVPGPGVPGPGVPGPGVPGPGIPAPAVPVSAVREAVRAAPRSAAASSELRWIMISYLMVPFFGFLVPLAVFLASRRRPARVREHAVQALNVSLTVLMYDVSAAIMAAMLALDSPMVALSVAGTAAVALWLVTLAFLVRAGNAAGRGEEFRLPHWLCASLVR